MKHKLFFLLLFCLFFISKSSFDFFIKQNFTTKTLGLGTLAQPYNNIFQSFYSLSTNKTFIANLNLAIDKRVNLILMSEFYMIKTDDFPVTTKPAFYKVFTNVKVPITIMPRFCYDFYYPDNLDNCPSNTTIELIFKFEGMKFDIYNSMRLINLRFSGRELYYSYNAAQDSSCYFTREGCCSNDSYFMIDTPNQKCLLQNKILIKNEATMAQNSMFSLLAANSSFILLNFEMSYFFSTTVDYVYYSNFLGDSNNLYLYLNWMNCTFSRFYLMNNLIYMLSNKKSFFYFNNISVIDQNYFQIFQKSSASSVNYYPPKPCFYINVNIAVNGITLFFNNSRFVNSFPIFKINNLNFTIANCEFCNLTRFFTTQKSIEQALILTTSIGTEESNMSIHNISVLNYYVSLIPNKYYYYMSLHLNIVISNLTFSNISNIFTGSSIYTFCLIEFALMSTSNISNIFARDIYSESSLIIIYESSLMNISNIFFTNVLSRGNGGFFNVEKKCKIDIKNGSFENFKILGYSNRFDTKTLLEKIKGKGGMFYFETDSFLSLFVVNITNGTIPEGEGLVAYFESNSIFRIMSCWFKNVSAFYGGSIANMQQNVTELSISDSIFDNIYGNAFLHLNWVNIIIKNCKFENSLYENSTDYGLIYMFQNNSISISDTLFKDLNLNVEGGILYCIHYNLINFTNLIFHNINISKNYAILYSEGNNVFNATNCSHNYIYVSALFYYFGFQAFTFIYNNTFKNMVTFGTNIGNGGIFYIGDTSIITFDQLNFENITLSNLSPGGILYFSNSRLSFSNIIVQKFYVAEDGGIIYSNNYNSIDMFNVSFDEIIGNSGGLLFLNLMNTIQIQRIYANNISSLEDGGIIFSNEGNQIQLSNGIFKNVGCQRFGGFLRGITNNIFRIFDIEIFNSSAGRFKEDSSSIGEGGFIYLSSLNYLSLVNIYGSNITSERKGGCFSFFGGMNNFTLKNSTFIISKAVSGNGGFLSTSGNIGKNAMNITNIFVLHIFANNSGGIFSFENNFNIIRIFDSYFYDSNASLEFGGGFAVADKNNFVIYNDTFINSVCNLQGGFLYSHLNNVFNISYCNIMNASSSTANGGSINLEQSNIISIFGTNFSMLSSFFDGGGFYFYNGNFAIFFSCKFIGSKSKNKGGLIASFKSNQIFLNDSQIVNISAVFQGCLISMYENNSFQMNNSNLLSLLNNRESSLIESFFSSNVTVTRSFIDVSILKSLIKINENSNAIFSKNTISKNSTFIEAFISYNSQINIEYILFDLYVPNYFMNTENSIVKIKYCVFQSRNASASSFLTFLQSTAIFSNCIFTKNSQNSYTMIYAENSNVSFKNSVAYNIRANNSGTLLSLKNSNLKSSKNFFFRNKAYASGGVFSFFFDILNNKTMKIRSSYFINNAASSYGGSIYFQNMDSINNQSVQIKNSKFFSNTAFKGGAIYAMNAGNFIVYQNTFKKNSARLNKSRNQRAKGGAIFNYNANMNSMNLKSSNIFNENSAEIGGASYTENLNIPLLSNNEYSANIASCYGNDDATDVKLISFYEKNDQTYTISKFSINEIQSGNNYNSCLAIVTGRDEYSNVVYNTDEFYDEFISIEQNSPHTIISNNRFSYVIKNGFLCFNGTFKRNQIPIQSNFKYNIYFKNQTNTNLSLAMNFRDCEVGERLTDDRTCDPCPLNTYSFVIDFSRGTTEKCHICDETTNFYCFGKHNLTSKKGYWRLNEFSTNFIKCQNSACLGDTRAPSNLNIINKNISYDSRFATSLCETGYTGIVCNECEENYGHVDNLNCLECGSSTYSFNLVLQLVLRVLFTIYSVYQEYIMVCSICSQDINQNEVITTNILKTFVNHMQVLTIIRAFPFEWPSEFSFSAGIFLSFTPNVSEGLSLECILKGSYFNISSQYFKLIICFIYPFVLTFLSLIFIRIVQSFKKDKMKFLMARTSTIAKKRSISVASPLNKSSKLRDSAVSFENLDKYIKYNWVITSVFLCILILCFPDIIKVILSMFACFNFGDSKNIDYRLLSDYTVKCNTQSHDIWKNFFGVPFLLLIGICFPFFVTISMIWAYHKKKMEKKDRETLFKFGFFYYAYKSKLFFWDLVILIRKMLLLFINIFYMSLVDVNKDLTPILLVFLILVISVLLQYHFCPFDEEKYNIVNQVESISLSTLVITILATLFYFGETAIGHSLQITVVSFLVMVTVIANIFFLIYFMKAFYIHNIKVKLKMAKDKSELIFSKLKTLKGKLKMSSMWTSIVKRFSSKSTSLESSPEKITKSKSRVISLFKSNYDPNLKMELFSPLKKLSKAEKAEQKKIFFVLGEILLKRGKDEMERYNLLMLEQERINQKVMEMKNGKQIPEVDLGEEIPEEREEVKQRTNLFPKASSFVHNIYNNKYYYNLACLNQDNLLVSNAFFSVKSKTKLKNNKFADSYLKITVEINLKEEVDEFNYEMKEGEGKQKK